MLGAITWLFALEAAQHETEYARTAAVSLLVLFEAVYLISSRHLNRTSVSLEGLTGNRAVLLSIAAVALFQLLFVYTSPFPAAVRIACSHGGHLAAHLAARPRIVHSGGVGEISPPQGAARQERTR